MTLQRLLERYCPDVRVVGSAANVSEGLQVIPSLKPDLVFMDIAMPDGDAFDLLRELGNIDFEIVLIAA